MTKFKPRDLILINRYASRRLYNTKTSQYITLAGVADLIRAGHDIKITDKATGDDLTRQYLLQIIADHETRGEQLLPHNILVDIVRSYNDSAQSMVPDFLAQSFEMIKQHQQELMGSVQQQVSDAFDPEKATQNFQKWQQTQLDFYNQAFGSIMPGMTKTEKNSDPEGE